MEVQRTIKATGLEWKAASHHLLQHNGNHVSQVWVCMWGGGGYGIEVFSRNVALAPYSTQRSLRHMARRSRRCFLKPHTTAKRRGTQKRAMHDVAEVASEATALGRG